MNKTNLNILALANTLGLLGLVGYLLCLLGTILFPEVLMALSNSWFHGVDLTVLTPKSGDWVFGTGNVVLGLITFPLVSWITGWVIGWLYNKLAS